LESVAEAKPPYDRPETVESLAFQIGIDEAEPAWMGPFTAENIRLMAATIGATAIGNHEGGESEEEWSFRSDMARAASPDAVRAWHEAGEHLCGVARCVFGRPTRPERAIDPAWLAWNGGVVGRLAEAVYHERELPSGNLYATRLGLVADALEDAGCSDAALLGHLRGPGPSRTRVLGGRFVDRSGLTGGFGMRKRKLRWVLAGLAVLVTVGAFVAWPRALPPSHVTRESFRCIRMGMSKSAVEAVFGPPGDFFTGDVEPDFDGAEAEDLGQSPDLYPASVERVELWSGDRALIQVQFDAGGKVSGASCVPLKPVDHGPLGNLLWRPKRQWRKWFPE
jgi:hypothetical protein